jgi:decaprenyl-phosphate phosphoribosyltransferase
MRAYLELLRPKQWVKNFFLFIPLLFDFRIDELSCLLLTFSGFIAFSMAASSIYILNDYRDRESDRKHPFKKDRPLAAETVTIPSAMMLLLFLLLGSFAISFMVLPHMFMLYITVYLMLNVLYSLGLKHVPLLDVVIIATGFVLRVFAGASICFIEPSAWLIAMTFLLALFIALAKRRDDVLIFLKSGEKMRKSMDGYNLEFVNIAMSIMGSVVIVAYLMYSLSTDVIERLNTDNLYLSTVFVILGVLRYLQLTFVEQNTGSPTELIFTDRFLQLTLIAWVISAILILYT